MILSRIDDELTVYKNHTVVIFGTGSAGRKVYTMLSSFGIKAALFCDNNSELWDQNIQGLDVISPEELQTRYCDDYLIQIGSSYEKEIEKQLLNMGITNYITYSEVKVRLANLHKYKFFKKYPELQESYLDAVNKEAFGYVQMPPWERVVPLLNDDEKEIIFVLQPMKTGNHTVKRTAEANGIDIVASSHTWYWYHKELRRLVEKKPIKIITATRDPISQNLSLLYHNMDWFWDRDIYWKNGGDPSALLKVLVKEEETKRTGLYAARWDPFHIMQLVQHYFEYEFKQNLNIDIYNYPFNKEEGYDIIKFGNVEIFIYQLEKLNNIYKNLLDFLNIKNKETNLVSHFRAEERWDAKYYKETVKNVQISKEYFDACYNSTYVKHFYSDEDIEKFKDKWGKHIV